MVVSLRLVDTDMPTAIPSVAGSSVELLIWRSGGNASCGVVEGEGDSSRSGGRTRWARQWEATVARCDRRFDSRSGSVGALSVAASFASRIGARLWVVHAIELHDYPPIRMPVVGRSVWDAVLTDDAERLALCYATLAVRWDYQVWRGECRSRSHSAASEVQALII